MRALSCSAHPRQSSLRRMKGSAAPLAKDRLRCSAGLTTGEGPSEEKPATDEEEPTEGSNRAEPARASEAEPIEAPREEAEAGEHKPRDPSERDTRPIFKAGADPEERERVIELIADTCLKGVERPRIEGTFEKMGSEGS